MVAGSPAWKPQAMLAEVIHGITAESSPSCQRPQLSPMSTLMSAVGEPAALWFSGARGDGRG